MKIKISYSCYRRITPGPGRCSKIIFIEKVNRKIESLTQIINGCDTKEHKNYSPNNMSKDCMVH